MTDDQVELVELSAKIVAAYVAHNNLPRAELSSFIATTHATLQGVTNGTHTQPLEIPAEPTPAVPIKKSVTRNAIICLEDGLAFKTLKRHLASKYDLTPQQYRAKWKLPPDYPMVAPAYAESRSALAKATGLGRKAPPPAAPSKSGNTKRLTRRKKTES